MLRLIVGAGGAGALIWVGSRLQSRHNDRTARESASVEVDEEHLAHQISLKTTLDDTLGDNQSLFNAEELRLVDELIKLGQLELFKEWPAPGVADDEKRQLINQLVTLNNNYPGGLKGYIQAAKQLLQDSKAGKNTFLGYVPEVPDGVTLDCSSEEFNQFHDQGVKEAGAAAFVLVAGGLGERLGYSGIKVALPVESASGRSFLQLYIESILALQARSAGAKKLPLVIMTSDDTHARTEALLQEHGYFGMDPSQVTLLKQEKVACLADGDARLATAPEDRYSVLTKPHGHGDVHALLHSSGLLDKWSKAGIKWVCFFQDTNGLVFRALPAALGVSAARKYDVNSLAVPRKAKEAIGALALLKPSDPKGGKRPMTINVEYNLLDPLLRATVNPEGDVNDAATGLSPFPGNINQLVFALPAYKKVLADTKGAVPQFVNPKYKDASRTAFKTPTRLECMMQDLPSAYPPKAKVGFTVINQVWASYSPVKNHPSEARAKAEQGNPTHSATTGELDAYRANCELLQAGASADVAAPQPSSFNGIPADFYPRVVLAPSFALGAGDVKAKVEAGTIKLGEGAVLVLEGSGIRIEGLEVAANSALVVRATEGAQVVVKGLKVQNRGWSWEPLPEGQGSEEQAIRGFKVVKHETEEYVFDQPGSYQIPEPAPAAPEPEPAAAPEPAPAAAEPAAPPAADPIPAPPSPQAPPPPAAAPAPPTPEPVPAPLAVDDPAPAPPTPEPVAAPPASSSSEPRAPATPEPAPTPVPAAPTAAAAAAPPAADEEQDDAEAAPAPSAPGGSSGTGGGGKKKRKNKGKKK